MPSPEDRIESAVREFSHSHHNGVCERGCYGCFLVEEGRAAIRQAVREECERVSKIVEEVMETVTNRILARIRGENSTD